MTNDYIVKKVFNTYLSISIIATVAATLGMLIDGIVISNCLGSQAMAAFGLAGPVFTVFTAISGVFSHGSVSVCAKYLGQDDTGKLNATFTAITIVSVLISGILTIICMLFPGSVAQIFGASGALITPTADYIRGIGMGAVPIILSSIIIAFARIDGSPDIGMKSIIAMSIVNISLDLLNAFVFKQGMLGMALATSISYLAALLVSGIHFKRKTNTLHFTKMGHLAEAASKVVITGAPNAVNRLCIMARTTLLNRLLLVLGGSMAIAALSIQSTINSLLSGVCLGVGSTILLLSGIFYGEKDKRALADAVKVSLRTGFWLTAVISVIGIIFAKPIIMIFASADAALIPMAVRTLIMYLISLPFYTVSVVAMNYYQSTDNLFMANFVCVLDNFLFMMLFSGLLAVPFGTDGVWVSFILCELAMIATLIITVWIRTGSFPKKIEDFLMIPEEKDEIPERELNLSISNDMKQVMKLSERIGEFCLANQVEERNSRILSLAIEEMVGNVVQHAFTDQKPHFIDIRIILKGGDIILRIRDDGKYFNPVEYYRKALPEQNGEQNGITLIHKIAKSVDYRNTVKMNNLIVRI